MILTKEQQLTRIRLIEGILLLCKNVLQYESEFTLEALIGITIDKSTVFLVNINETVDTKQTEVERSEESCVASNSKGGPCAKEDMESPACVDKCSSDIDDALFQHSKVHTEEIKSASHVQLASHPARVGEPELQSHHHQQQQQTAITLINPDIGMSRVLSLQLFQSSDWNMILT